MIKLLGIAVITSFTYLYVKRYSSEYALAVELSGVVLILLTVLPFIKDVIDFFFDMSSYAGADRSYIGTVVKCVGIAFVAQLASDICRDAGQNATAAKIELAGKLMMAVLALPIAKALLETALKMIGA